MRNGFLPALVGDADLERVRKSEDENKAKILARLTQMRNHRPLLHALSYNSDFRVENVWMTRCFNCQEVAVWVGGMMAYPEPITVGSANPDTPPDIMRDYDEARSIVQKSPRGAAALLRLAIQKLCKHLGESGKNINDDIASLVAKGLDYRIQKALDVLRVIGNEAVHPGTIDLNDDPNTAESLFKLFNLIVEKMISEPKLVEEVYASLPPEKLKQIEQRDKEKGGH
ncbi:DUF4145 domain-containing protein [Rhizobium leguminosarum bv. viciae]|nr:DUF4145 domain-containing protein [Rhizobium leguminosarum bv. viciae]